MAPHIRSHRAPCSCFPKKVSLQLSSEQSVGDVWITQLGPDLQNILRQSYDYRTVMQKLRSTYDGRVIYKTSHDEWKAFHTYDSRAKSQYCRR